MRIYELLNPVQPQPTTAPNPIAPLAQPSVVQPTPQPQQRPMQSANMLTDFFSTPHPIGGAPSQPQTPPIPGTNAAGQPGWVDRGINNTFIGDINRGLAPTPPPQQPPKG